MVAQWLELKAWPGMPPHKWETMSGKQRKYLVIHCTATPEGRKVTSDDIRAWHMMPLDVYNGKKYLHTIYKGVKYTSREKLPNESINGISIKKGHGRGWKQVGYCKMIHLDGTEEILVPDNGDNIVDAWEITNGATGINSESMHVVYVGGMNATNTQPKDTRTKGQIASLLRVCLEELKQNKTIIIAGHNHFAAKACPSFDVTKWARESGFPLKNIFGC